MVKVGGGTVVGSFSSMVLCKVQTTDENIQWPFPSPCAWITISNLSKHAMLLFFRSWLQMEQSTFHLLSSRLPPFIRPSIHLSIHPFSGAMFKFDEFLIVGRTWKNCLSQKKNDQNSNISPCKNIT
jgi:hypothetical protein